MGIPTARHWRETYPGPAGDLLARATAPVRHAARVEAAAAVALWAADFNVDDGPALTPDAARAAYPGGRPPEWSKTTASPEDREEAWAARAAIFAVLAARSAGGPLALGLEGTARPSYAGLCGTGRRNAGDGSAWDAAFAAASWRHAALAAGGPNDLALVPMSGGAIGLASRADVACVGPALTRTMALGSVVVANVEGAGGLHHLAALCRAAILTLAGVRDLGETIALPLAGTVEGWSELLAFVEGA